MNKRPDMIRTQIMFVRFLVSMLASLDNISFRAPVGPRALCGGFEKLIILVTRVVT